MQFHLESCAPEYNEHGLPSCRCALQIADMDELEVYEAQGYELPLGVTRDDVVTYREQWDLDPLFVPLTGAGCAVTAWGVPFIDGKPLQHA